MSQNQRFAYMHLVACDLLTQRETQSVHPGGVPGGKSCIVLPRGGLKELLLYSTTAGLLTSEIQGEPVARSKFMCRVKFKPKGGIFTKMY